MSPWRCHGGCDGWGQGTPKSSPGHHSPSHPCHTGVPRWPGHRCLSPSPCARWDGVRRGEHSPGAVQLPLPTTGQVPAPLTHRSPTVLGESLRFHGHDLKLRRGALQQEAARSGLARSGSPRTEHLPAVQPPAALAFSTHTRRFPRFGLRLGAAWGGQGGAGLGAGGCERGEERSVSTLGCREQGL